MSSSGGDATGPVTDGRSRLSNGSDPAKAASASLPPDSQSPDDREVRPDVPMPEERIAGLLERFPEKMFTPVSEQHGRKLRDEALDEEESDVREIEVTDTVDGVSHTITVSETVGREALPLVAVMEEFLEWYENYRNKYLKLVKGNGYTESKEEFFTPLDNSFQPAYQKATYAKLKALKRILLGSDEQDPYEYAGAFEEPVTVLFGLTASGTRSDGSPRPIIDHARSVQDAWTGSSSSVRRRLRYLFEEKMGLESDEWAWWNQSEPHPGEGDNAGYHHSHPVVIFDRAAVSGDLDVLDVETYRPIVTKHISECEGAGWSAHRIREEGKSSVTVREADEIQAFAGYVAEYIAVDPDQDLLERSDEYLMYAAANWASTSQKYTKDATASAAIEVDKCHQRCRDERSKQDYDHAEMVVERDGENVCFACGESFGVPQEESATERTLTEVRLAADGGETLDADDTVGAWNEEKGCFESDVVADRWPSARSAVAVGSETVARECHHTDGANECPLCAEETGAVSADVPIPDTASPPREPQYRVEKSGRRPARWRPESIVDRGTGDETLVGPPGGSVFGEVLLEREGSINNRLGGRALLPSWLEGSEPWKDSPVTEAEVRSGEVPPPELVAREYAESVQSDRRVTQKEWRDDWYARRFERVEDGPDVDRERVEEFVRSRPGASVVEVMGALGLAPSARSVVEDVVAY